MGRGKCMYRGKGNGVEVKERQVLGSAIKSSRGGCDSLRKAEQDET